MIVRAARAADEAPIGAVITAAFGDGGQVAALSSALSRRPETGVSLVADTGGTVIGHVQLSISWVDSPDRVVEVLVLSPLSVRPDHQRRGVGRALVAAARDEAQRLGAPALFLEGDPRYYGRLGFEPGRAHGFIPPSVRIPTAAFQVMLLAAYEPGVSGALVYNDTFWSHDCVGLRPPPTA